MYHAFYVTEIYPATYLVIKIRRTLEFTFVSYNKVEKPLFYVEDLPIHVNNLDKKEHIDTITLSINKLTFSYS